MALTKVSGGILDPGISVAGIVTATGFDGPFTGGSSSNITAGIITATGFDLNGNGDISGNLVVGGNLTANGDFTTLNTTLREVELLRVDANSSAIAGIITQRGSGDIFSVYDTSTEVFKIADGGDVAIGRSIYHLNDIDTHIGFPAANQVKITAGNEVNTTFTSSTVGFNKKLVLRSSAVIDQEVSESSATVPTLRIRNTGNHTLVSFQNINTASTIIQWNDYGSSTTAGNLIFRSSNGSAYEEHARFTGAGNFNLSKDLDVTGNAGIGSLSVTGISTFNDNVIIPDNKKLILGTQSGRQLHLYHNMVGSSNHVIESTSSSNHLVVKATTINPRSDYFSFRNYAHNQDVFLIDADGQTKLFFNGNDKLTTTGYGVTVTGITSATSFTASEGGISGQYTRNQIKWDRNNYNYIDCTNDSGQFAIRMGSSQTAAFSVDTSADTIFPNNRKIKMGNDKLQLYHDGTNGVMTNSSGNFTFTNSGSSYSYVDSSYFRVRSNSGGHMIEANAAGANQGVRLFHTSGASGGGTLITTSTGIDVTGEVAASQDYPDFKPALDLNFSLTKKLDPRITFTRDGLGSFVDENGDLKYSTNAPRFDHDPITKECKGLLMEKSKANLLLYSNQMNYGGNRTLEFNTTDVVAPDGTNTAVKMILTSTAYGYAYPWNNNSSDSNRVGRRLSYWIKKGDYDLIHLTNGNHLRFTFSTKSFTNSGTYTYREKVEEYPNDWYRVSYTIPEASSNQTLIGKFQGSTNGVVAYFWGFQLEEDGYETSYIPTDGASVTRAAESAVIDGEEFNEFFSHNGVEFNDYRGTLISFSEEDYYANLTAARYNKVQLELSNDNKISLAIVGDSSSPYVQGMISYGTATQINGTSSGGIVPTILKHGIAFAKNSGAYTYNGNVVQTDNTMNVSNASLKYTQLTIGGQPSKTHLKRIIYYTNRISNTQLRNLTS